MKIDRHGQAKILTQSEIRLLFSQGLQSDRSRALFGICLYCCCRINEACTLNVKDVYSKGRVRPELLRGIQENPNYLLVSIGLLIFILAFFSLASTILVVTITFDKNFSKITVKEQKLFNTNVREHSLNEISDVRIESSNGVSYKLIGVLRSGKRLTLSLPTQERILEESIAQIRSFLGYY